LLPLDLREEIRGEAMLESRDEFLPIPLQSDNPEQREPSAWTPHVTGHHGVQEYHQHDQPGNHEGQEQPKHKKLHYAGLFVEVKTIDACNNRYRDPNYDDGELQQMDSSLTSMRLAEDKGSPSIST
jgi:hypothetical protein